MEEGMIPLDKVLAQLVQQGLVEREIAESYVLDNDYFMSLLG
jgi:Tfp pilus assembly pilus retraction ATPase PilT